MTSSDRRWAMLVGAVQGLLLLAAHEVVVRKLWPATVPSIVLAWYAMVIGVPAALQLLMPAGRRPRLWGYAVALALVLGAIGAYAGYAIGGQVDSNRFAFYFAFALTAGVAWFIALPFAAVWIRSGSWRASYPQLFAEAWNNTLTLIIAAVFTGTFWALLWLWAGLFAVVGINFFKTLFSQREFVYPVTAMAFGYAVHLGYTHQSAVVTVRKVVLSVYRGLLPLAAVIALLFLLVLPGTGLQPLWETGHAAALMLTLQIALIVFLNAAYQDGQADAPYAPWLRRLVELAVIALPVYSALTVHALYLRVQQHGWTSDRVWATLIAVIVALYALGYLFAALRRRAQWLAPMGQVNVAMAVVIVAALIAANSPVLDPKRIASASQVGRLLAGKVAVADFDFMYLRLEVGRHGIKALDKLKALDGHPEAAAIRQAAGDALARSHRWAEVAPGPDQFAKGIRLYPVGKKLDPAFIQFVVTDKDTTCTVDRKCLVLAMDLNKDGTEEYVFLNYPFTVFEHKADGWRQVGRLEPTQGLPRNLGRLMSEGHYKAVPAVWPNLQVGNKVYVMVDTADSRR